MLTFDMDISGPSDYKDFEWAIKLNRQSLKLLGLWPNNDGISQRNIGANIRMSFTLIMIVFVFGIPIVHAFVRVWGNMILMIDNLRMALPMLAITLKLIIMRWKQPVMISIINMIKEDWMTSKLETERDVMMKHGQFARLIVICYYALTIPTVILMTFLTYFDLPFRYLTNLTDRNKPLIVQTYYFYNTDKSPQFELTYLTQVISLNLGVIIYVSIDSFLGFVILHICGQLKNFRDRLANLIAGKEFNKALSSNVVVHVRLIRYVNNVEDVFTLIMLASILYMGLMFCLAGFVLIITISSEKISNVNFTQMYYMIIVIIILILQLFLYCCAGELLIDHCEALYFTICNLEWYKWEAKEAKNLILLMIRVQQPLRITAGKIVPLTMATFSSLLKTSGGYLSFLLAIQN